MPKYRHPEQKVTPRKKARRVTCSQHGRCIHAVSIANPCCGLLIRSLYRRVGSLSGSLSLSLSCLPLYTVFRLALAGPEVSGRETHQAHHNSLGTPIGLASSGWYRDQTKASAMASQSAGRARISFRRALERHGTSKSHNLNSCRVREMVGGEGGIKDTGGKASCMSFYIHLYPGSHGCWRRRRWNICREKGTMNGRPSA